VKPFRYWRDRLFLVGCALYALNRWVTKPRIHDAFLHGYFNDLLLIPCALPVLLFFERHVGLRSRDEPPTWREIGFYFVVWSILFEVIGPHLMRGVTGDWRDVIAYAIGAVAAGLWWNRARWPRMEAVGR